MRSPGAARPSSGEKYDVEEIPSELQAQAEEYREKLLEQLADLDDSIAEKYLEGEEISVAELKAAIRKATIANKANPVLTGSAFKNKGVQPMLDAVIDYLPSPLDVPDIDGTLMDGETPASRTPTSPSRCRPSRSRSRPTRTWAS